MNKDKSVLGIAIFSLILSLIGAYLVFLRPSPLESYQEGYHDGYRAGSARKIAYGGGGNVSFGIMQPDSNIVNAITLHVPGTDIGRWARVELRVMAPPDTHYIIGWFNVPKQETTAVTFDDVIVGSIKDIHQ